MLTVRLTQSLQFSQSRAAKRSAGNVQTMGLHYLTVNAGSFYLTETS